MENEFYNVDDKNDIKYSEKWSARWNKKRATEKTINSFVTKLLLQK